MNAYRNQNQCIESKNCFAFLLDWIWRLTGRQSKLRSGIFGPPPLGKISWSVIQSFTVSSHLILHSHLFSLWGWGNFFLLSFDTHWKLEIGCFWELCIPSCTLICRKVQRQQSNSLTSLCSLSKDFVAPENDIN